MADKTAKKGWKMNKKCTLRAYYVPELRYSAYMEEGVETEMRIHTDYEIGFPEAEKGGAVGVKAVAALSSPDEKLTIDLLLFAYFDMELEGLDQEGKVAAVKELAFPQVAELLASTLRGLGPVSKIPVFSGFTDLHLQFV